jgi:cytochrome c peroxidase
VQPNFTDDQFHNTGVGVVDGVPKDPGRFAISGAEHERGAFKTPTLRGLAFTAPYMHDGSQATLEEVVAFYRRGGEKNPWLDRRMEPLDLTDEEARVLVVFLRMLSRTETESGG